MSLAYLADQMTIYFGTGLLIAGVFGNGMNILIFCNKHFYRTSPSTFYYLAGSVTNTIYILIYLTTRIATAANGIDLTLTSLAWCKGRSFAAGSLGPISFTCSCLAMIDQFFITSRKVNIRQYSSIKRAHLLLTLTIIFWFIHGSIGTIYFNITPVRCLPTNIIYNLYVNIFIIVFLFAIPVAIMSLFGYLTYRHLGETIGLAGQNAERQVTYMMLVQVILIIISMVPYGTFYTYRLITSGIVKSSDQSNKENFVTIFLTLISYFYYIGNFYMFCISSSRFRVEVKKRILFCRRQVTVFPAAT